MRNNTQKSDRPLPYLEEQVRKEDERLSLGLDLGRRKCAVRDSLAMIVSHRSAMPILLRSAMPSAEETPLSPENACPPLPFGFGDKISIRQPLKKCLEEAQVI